MPEERFTAARQRMVQTQLFHRGISDPAILTAFRRVPRHLFVPPEERGRAYEDHPLPIPCGQTISQPYVVAYMFQKLELDGSERVLEIGMGSGYQTALLAELTSLVYSVEFFPKLATEARRILAELGYDNIESRVGDGCRGWPEAAPFDAIIGSAAPEEVPQSLFDQLAPGGRLIMPVGRFRQQLVRITRTGNEQFQRTDLLPVRFVPMQSGSPAES
jgi:protein-L-isoaspartate(D-aspartate) O-methyltransferase